MLFNGRVHKTADSPLIPPSPASLFLSAKRTPAHYCSCKRTSLVVIQRSVKRKTPDRVGYATRRGVLTEGDRERKSSWLVYFRVNLANLPQLFVREKSLFVATGAFL